ncbi:MAG TPA: glycoside hydrolase family 27 protein [Candidatus Angelobacter sp.]|nr:glycoside hydrolase family 27 protein [Candidatus Angelobacter sp.]
MGWNTYDSYGTAVNEAQVKANARWLARHLKPFGWRFVVIDMEWFVTNPTPSGNSKNSQYTMDEFGRYTPAPNRFPSAANGAGFKPLADYVHALGLKLGIHILRGIPKQAVDKDLPIADSDYHASQAADRSDTCPWNPDNYGIAQNPAGQAYYSSVARQYAAWGVDFIKVDCIASHPYKGDEIDMISRAIDQSQRSMVLSLSPGPAPQDKAKLDELRSHAQMWRISEDVWDLWHSEKSYPQGVGDQFSRAAAWAPLAVQGHWPDLDMLPIGPFAPSPGWGPPRLTRLTHDEQRTLMTLWSIARSPLMIGGNLTELDAWTTSLLTNPEILAVDQHSSNGRPVLRAGNATEDAAMVWRAQASDGDGEYLAVFNRTETSQAIEYRWKDLGLEGDSYSLRDLWEHKNLGRTPTLKVQLPGHGAVLYRVRSK